MGHDIEFTPEFKPTDYVDGVDRVTASGANGFNARFRALQADLNSLSQRVAEINAALNDDRDQFRSGLATVTNDCVLFGAFEIFAVSGDNNLKFANGAAIVEGHPVQSATSGFSLYSDQPWADPGRAAADGVPVIPPLTTPSTDRTDSVYLDTWERLAEVNGVRRLVREVAVRVNEGRDGGPVPLPGHHHMVVAFLLRKAGEPRITNDAIQDHRPQADRGPKQRAVSALPVFHPQGGLVTWEPWRHMVNEGQTGRMFAHSPMGEQNTGMLPLPLPAGARRILLAVEGKNHAPPGGGGLNMSLRQSTSIGPGGSGDLAVDVVPPGAAFSRTIRPPVEFVVNIESALYLFAFAGASSDVEISRVTVFYDL